MMMLGWSAAWARDARPKTKAAGRRRENFMRVNPYNRFGAAMLPKNIVILSGVSAANVVEGPRHFTSDHRWLFDGVLRLRCATLRMTEGYERFLVPNPGPFRLFV